MLIKRLTGEKYASFHCERDGFVDRSPTIYLRVKKHLTFKIAALTATLFFTSLTSVVGQTPQAPAQSDNSAGSAGASSSSGQMTDDGGNRGAARIGEQNSDDAKSGAGTDDAKPEPEANCGAAPQTGSTAGCMK